MREISKLFKTRAIQLYFDERFYEVRNLTSHDFDVLLGLAMVTTGTKRETASKGTLRSFIQNYLRPISVYKLNEALDNLHENSYVWINSTLTVSITKLGINMVKEVYNAQYNFDKGTLRPILRALNSGKVEFDGTITAKENIRKKQSNNPYIGVKRVAPHKWMSSILVNKKRINLGTFSKPTLAAKARDAYIIENKLKHKLSLKNKYHD